MTEEDRQEAIGIALTELLHSVYVLADQLGLSLDDMIEVMVAVRADVDAMKMATCVPQGELN